MKSIPTVVSVVLILIVCQIGLAHAPAENADESSPRVEATFEYHQLIPRVERGNALWLADGTVAVHDEQHIAYFRAAAEQHHYEVVRMRFNGSNPVVAMKWHDQDTRRPESMVLAGDTLFVASAVTLRSVRLNDSGQITQEPKMLARFSQGMGLRSLGQTPIVMVNAATQRIDVEPMDTTPSLGGIYALADNQLRPLVTGHEVCDLLGFKDPNAVFGIYWIAFDIVPTANDGWALTAVVQVGNQANYIISKRSSDAAPRILDKSPPWQISAVTISRDGSQTMYDMNDQGELRLVSIDGANPPVAIHSLKDGFNTFRRSPRLFLSADKQWALAGWSGVLFQTDGSAGKPESRLQASAAWSALEGVVLQPNMYRPTMYHNPWKLVYSLQEWDGEVNWISTAEVNKTEPDARPVPRLTDIRFDPIVISSNYQKPTLVSVRLDTKLPVKRVEGVLMEGNIVPPNNQHYMFQLYDSGNAQNGDEKQGDGIYSALIFVPPYHANSHRSVRLSAEVEDEQKLHHAWAVQLGPIPVSADPPGHGNPVIVGGSNGSAPDPKSPTKGDPPIAVNSSEAQRALDMSVGLIPVDLALDVDKDGAVTAGDARLLLQRGGQ